MKTQGFIALFFSVLLGITNSYGDANTTVTSHAAAIAPTPHKKIPQSKHLSKKNTATKKTASPIQKNKHSRASKKNIQQKKLSQKQKTIENTLPLSSPSEIATTPRLISGEVDTSLKIPAQEKKEVRTKQSQENALNTAENEDDVDEDDEDDNEEELTSTPAPSSKKIMIRVLLKEFPTEQKVTFSIQSKRGFVLESPIGSGKRAQWKHEILNLLAYKHNLFVLTESGAYKRIKTNELAIASVDGDLKIDNYRYTGTIYMRIDPKTKNIQIVNKVNLDDYIYAVLRYESLSYWPLEMQKIQAVASRTYAVRQIKVTRSNTTSIPFYDIKNTNSHQVYNGNHDSTHLREAVNATHNLILTYNGDIALTMFDICCGGIIPGYMKKRDADKPYLYRKTRCTYCHNKANFEWKCTLSKETLSQKLLESSKLSSKAKKIGKIIGISLKEKDRAGIVHHVLIHGSKNNISFTNNEFKSALGSKAKSNAYVVKKLQDTISVHGYGFGHNMGLCQIGARELVARGRNYQEILDFYFPKTRLMRLKVI
ncbi:SpoIID/LytB domain-containing protein [Candidatus Dependentiae bacterium]|nr:SpoIID/LytB domain-containing protein [Candidatus Dependentiae bacterium]